MAALTVFNDILGIFNDSCNFVINLKTKHYQHLKSLSISQSKLPQDQYLGLITYCSSFSNNGQWYAIADQKTLTIWSTATWTNFCTKILERAASQIVFAPSNESIIVADKTGDVYLYSLKDDNPKGILLLGHLSILLDVLITPDEKYIITCDRDEKIRVSYFPNAYNIQCFCLGHTEFVTKITLFNNQLLSCSGDGTMKFWSYESGNELYSYNVLNDIENSQDLDQCLITNLRTLDSLICLTVHKYNGLLVYKYHEEENFVVDLIQTIVCEEPFNFALNDHVLWILNGSLNAWLWNRNSFDRSHREDEKHVIDIVNRECGDLSKTSYIDLSILYKKYLMKEEKRKKIKLDS